MRQRCSFRMQSKGLWVQDVHLGRLVTIVDKLYLIPNAQRCRLNPMSECEVMYARSREHSIREVRFQRTPLFKK